MSETFSAESRLIHAGTSRDRDQPATPPLAPASIYVSEAELAIARYLAGHRRVRTAHYPGTAQQAADRVVAAARLILPVGVEPADDLIADIGHALRALETS